jgi:hypothetical protein
MIIIWHTLITFYQSRYFLCARGEIGKHSRLKICRPRGLAGSSPAERTTYLYKVIASELIYLVIN